MARAKTKTLPKQTEVKGLLKLSRTPFDDVHTLSTIDLKRRVKYYAETGQVNIARAFALWLTIPSDQEAATAWIDALYTQPNPPMWSIAKLTGPREVLPFDIHSEPIPMQWVTAEPEELERWTRDSEMEDQELTEIPVQMPIRALTPPEQIAAPIRQGDLFTPVALGRAQWASRAPERGDDIEDDTEEVDEADAALFANLFNIIEKHAA